MLQAKEWKRKRTMTTVHDIVIELRDQLDANIDDPISERASQGKNWIYEDFPRLDSTLPRIGFAIVDVQYTSNAVGTAKRVKNAVIQVSILVNEEGNKFDIDDDGNVEIEEEVVQRLGKQVEDVIVDNQDTIRDNLDARYVLPQSSVTIRPNGENVIQKNIDIEAEFV